MENRDRSRSNNDVSAERQVRYEYFNEKERLKKEKIQ